MRKYQQIDVYIYQCVCGAGNLKASRIDIVLTFFSYSGPSGILDSDGRQNTTWSSERKQNSLPVKRELGSVRIVALSISSHEQTQ